jgi:hypothetical protein
MARLKITAHSIGGTTGSSGEDRGSSGSKERTESARLSDMGLQGEAGDIVDNSWSFLFGSLSITVSRIHGMIDSGYFVEGMGHEPGEETVLKPHPDEAVVFVEFFGAGLRMPPHPVLAYILLKFLVQIHQLTPTPLFNHQNIFGRFQASGVSQPLKASRRGTNFTISRGR